MSSPRLRRLRLDYERLKARFDNWRVVEITGQAGIPPEQYQVTYRLNGLYAAADGRIIERDEHTAEINLSLGYPRRAPQCKMLTPIFHPNFDASSICIGDFWAASEGLDDLIVRIGRMIAYQEYNTKSPLNGLAARWAAENANSLPVDKREIAPPLPEQTNNLEDKVVIALSAEELPNDTDQLIASIDFGSGPYLLEYDVTTIGRAEDNLICIHSEMVSAHHAEIFKTPDGILLRDLGSTNGTWIGDVKLEGDAFLADQDQIRFGDVAGQLSVGRE